MPAFDKVRSGFPQLDAAIDSIRLGDNVVWQVSKLDEFRVFTEALARQAVSENRRIVYVRFATHEPLLPAMDGVCVQEIPLSRWFESFTVDIHRLIEREGRDVFYVFDCLSELEEAWATDMMMGNFFRLTCPFLFSLDTVAYFPILRGRHSSEAVSVIQETTQLFLDVIPQEAGRLFVRPIKVWNRTAPSMFRPHLFDPRSGSCRPLLGGVETSHYYRYQDRAGSAIHHTDMDSWERFFHETRTKYDAGLPIGAECRRMCGIMLTRDERMQKLIERYFEPWDYFAVHSRMVGTGMIGGKACGMLLSRKIVETQEPELYERIEHHDSFYVGSDVFYSFIVENGLWDLKIRQKEEESYFALAEPLSAAIREGSFSPAIRKRFAQILEYYGDEPIIVRSSSILEDGFGNAFAGKYESVFCASKGTLSQRLAVFEDAVRTVYASAVSLSALDYRKRRGLEEQDEQMGILVQRVSGSHYEDFFMPCAAGVAYSASPYRLGTEHPKKGMLRLVGGLGTAAVDRRTGSYPRMVGLDHPLRVWLTSSAERHQYSQRLIDVISDRSGQVESWDAETVRRKLPAYQQNLLYSHDFETERELQELGDYAEVLYVSCEKLIQTRGLMQDMDTILTSIQGAYAYPIDIEYTINCSPEGAYLINLLQCRPLQLTQEGDAVVVPEVGSAPVLLETKGSSMGFSRQFPLDVLVYVDAAAYRDIPYREKYRVKEAVSAINWKMRGQGKHMLLIVPGRVCTSSPELGVPTDFSDISEFDTIVEVSDKTAGYMPELSYGSHIFQDLVEAGILYSAVFEDSSTLHFRPEWMKRENQLTEFCSPAPGVEHVVFVQTFREPKLWEYYNMSTEHLMVLER